MSKADTLDMVIVGAGFAGLYMLHKAREQGLRAIVLEAGEDVGGTWYWNRYPGLRCDVESVQYSYSFSEEIQQEWEWSERYSTQAEILRYLQFVAERLDLHRDICFRRRVESAQWDEGRRIWSLTTTGGETYQGRYCVLATGAISTVQLPDIPGVESFAGETYHTGGWPADGVAVSGKRVGVIGTGSSGIQIVPEMAREAASLHLFQRTPPYVLEARNAPLAPAHVAKWKGDYAARRLKARMEPAGIFYDHVENRSALEPSEAERRAELQRCWDFGGALILATYNDVLMTREANEAVASFIREKIAETVTDPDLVRKLTPSFPIGAKRPPIGSNYYATFNLPHVSLVDLRETPIERVRPEGIETSEGLIPLDVIVYATGYDAITGAIGRIAITGVDGQHLADKWAQGPRTHLGLMCHGFPNLFLVTGPGSPSVLSNVVVSIEQHVEWIADCLAALADWGATRIEPELAFEDRWVDHVGEVADATLYPSVESWYVGANVPGKPRMFALYAGGVGEYRRIATEIAADGYRGFTIA